MVSDPNSIESNKVKAILEDSKGNYDSTHPDNLSRPPVHNIPFELDYITFIHEDAKGTIWIGTFRGGINQYDPYTKTVTHHGYVYKHDQLIAADTLAGFKSPIAISAFTLQEGLMWIAGAAVVFTMDPYRKPVIPYFKIRGTGANAFYEEENGSIWIGTDNGLVRKDINTGKEKEYLTGNVSAIQVDDEGTFWLGTYGGGLKKLNPVTGRFTSYLYAGKKNNVSSNQILNLYFANAKDLWIATNDSGISMLNIETSTFTHYAHDSRDSNSLSGNTISCIISDQNKQLWAGTDIGVCKLDKNKKKF